MTKEEFVKDLKEAFKKMYEKHVDKYIEGKDQAAYAHVTFNSDCSRIILKIWPDSENVSVCYACPELPYGDTGDEIASISMTYFRHDDLIELMAVIINKYMNWW